MNDALFRFRALASPAPDGVGGHVLLVLQIGFWRPQFRGPGDIDWRDATVEDISSGIAKAAVANAIAGARRDGRA